MLHTKKGNTVYMEMSMLMAEKETLYTIEEAARILRVSVSTIRRMIDAGELDAVKVRFQWRIKKSSVDKYL